MAKHKRKISASQRDKVAIAKAVVLKRKGLLSKQTKLHGGKYISRGVLKKVEQYQHVATPAYRTIEVPKKFADAAKEAGYEVVRGKFLVIPNDPEWIKRLKKAIKEFQETGKTDFLAGIRPVKGGHIEEVILPFDPQNIQELVELIESENIDKLKLPDEMFAFQVGGDQQGGASGMSWRGYFSSKDMAEKFRHYKPDIFVVGLKFFRLHPEDQSKFILDEKGRNSWRKKQSGMRQDARGNIVRKKSTRLDDLARINPRKAEKIRAHNREQARKQYEKKKNDPIYMMKARERARESYERRKREKIGAKKGRKK